MSTDKWCTSTELYLWFFKNKYLWACTKGLSLDTNEPKIFCKYLRLLTNPMLLLLSYKAFFQKKVKKQTSWNCFSSLCGYPNPPGLHQADGKERTTDILGATHGVMISTSAFLACHQCCCVCSSLAWGLNLWALVCGIFWSSSPGVFSGYSSFLPSFIDSWFSQQSKTQINAM